MLTGRGVALKVALLKLLAMAVAAAIWLPCIHLLFKPDGRRYRSDGPVTPKGRMMAARHLAVWTDPGRRECELRNLQARNPEWDFMGRTFLVLALANMALREPACRPQACEIMDLVIEHTLRIERERGVYHFLMDYARKTGPWKVQPPRSQFLDGEIALMLAARRMVEEKPEYRALLAERVEAMVARMRQSPVLSAESYPDECWLFCNTVALAAIRMADALDGTDHAPFLAEWVAAARARLVEPRTGLLISAYAVSGRPAPCGAGPEGSSIWMACHMLQLVDPDFAADQYRRARRHLGRSVLGFGYSREWPAASPGGADVDSGPVLPVLGASASASGLAILAAAAFDDRDCFAGLLASLNFLGFPVERDGQLHYRASNPVGDAVLLYAMVVGPLWEEVRRRGGP